MKMQLKRLGWNDSLAREFDERPERDLLPARVVREHRRIYDVWCEIGELGAEVSGRYMKEAAGRSDFPAVGDWVAIRPPPAEGRATIHRRLARRSRFLRKVAGTVSEAQVLAANVDAVFLVSGLDREFNLRRIERYVTLGIDCGASPVIVLNKADLCEDVDLRVRQVTGIAPDVPVLPASADLGTGVEALIEHLGPGRTGAFLGSSGVGKSTLINRLLGEERLETRAVREADNKGRHTTTHRELIPLPGERGLVIDTPGLREIQLWGVEEDLRGGFADLEELAGGCRFRDCRHGGEPGCAVQQALGEGTLDVGRYESYLDQRRELAHLDRKVNERAGKAERDRWRRITISQRKARRFRERGA
jgi:ribosome biogenesis GTPase